MQGPPHTHKLQLGAHMYIETGFAGFDHTGLESDGGDKSPVVILCKNEFNHLFSYFGASVVWVWQITNELILDSDKLFNTILNTKQLLQILFPITFFVVLLLVLLHIRKGIF